METVGKISSKTTATLVIPPDILVEDCIDAFQVKALSLILPTCL